MSLLVHISTLINAQPPPTQQNFHYLFPSNEYVPHCQQHKGLWLAKWSDLHTVVKEKTLEIKSEVL